VPTRDLGASAEDLAARHLARLGYRIVARNYRTRSGEIDLVGMDGSVLCFIEVRARTSADFGSPEETVGGRKQRRIILAAQHYLATQVRGEPACRFDVVGVDLKTEAVRLVKSAFEL
jgi:putative endonuclease